MELLYSFLFIIIIVGALAILYVYQYNKLQHSKTKIDQAESLIDESLRSRYDLLVKADTIIQNELESNKTYFKGLDKIKEENISNYDLDRKLTEYIGIMEQLKLDYSVLADSKSFKEVLSSL